MSDVKEVKVAMSAEEEKALTRLQTRRRKTRKAAVREEMEGGGDAAIPAYPEAVPDITATTVVQKEVPMVPAAHNAAAIPQAPVSPAPAPAAPTPAPAAPAMTGGAVKIQTRKRTHSERQAPEVDSSQKFTRKNTAIGGAKIVPTKRHAAPTKGSKPRLFVGGSALAAAPAQAAAVAVPAPAPAAVAAPQAPANAVAPVASQAGGSTHAKKKRRFTERRLSISMKHVATTRKHRKSIKKQIAKMSVEEIRKTLQKKGILRAKANPPEAMLRNMMRDFMMLGKPE